jgi:ankyrin repeat protein
MIASGNGKTDAVEILLDRGANIEATNNVRTSKLYTGLVF